MSVQTIDPVENNHLASVLHVLRPSEYTAALIQVLHGMRGHVRGAHVLEIGSGSGVVLAALAGLGAASLCGVDVEPDAMLAGRQLLEAVGCDARSEFKLGDMWLPVAGRRFDLVVANLPQFPTLTPDFVGRRTSWSHGGPDGRRLLEPFLNGLSQHITPGGRAVITHSGFINLARSRVQLKQNGLTARVVRTIMIPLPQERLERLDVKIRQREEGRSIHVIGPYSFAHMHIIDIRTKTRLT